MEADEFTLDVDGEVHAPIPDLGQNVKSKYEPSNKPQSTNGDVMAAAARLRAPRLITEVRDSNHWRYYSI